MDILNSNLVIPQNVSYLFERKGKSGGISTRYTSQYTTPDSGENGYRANQKITIRVPGTFIDWSTHYLQFTTSLFKVGGSYIRHRWNIGTIIRMIRITFGSLEVSLCDNFALIDTILQLLKPQGNIQTIGAQIRGLGDTTQRNNAQGTTYCLYLGEVMKILSIILPLQHIQSTMTIEITLNDNDNALETDGNAGSYYYTMDNVQLHYSELQADGNLENKLKSQIASGLCIPFMNYSTQTYDGQVAGVTSVSCQLSFKYLCMAGLIQCSQNAANFSASVNDLYRNFSGYTGFNNSYLKINNIIVPSDRLTSTNEVACAVLEAFGKCKDDEVYLFYNWPQYFINAFNFMVDPKVLDHNSTEPVEYIQGIASSLSGFSMQFYQQNSVNSNNLIHNFICQSYACIKVNGNGTITFAQ